MNDAARRAQQTQIALDYQHGVDRGRQTRDGVVVTPVEIVDFQVRSTLHQLQAQHGPDVDWSHPDIRITDPFGGTGIYLARLLQTCGLTIPQIDDLYHHRMQLIEIDPMAAAIADRNLRCVFEDLAGYPPRASIVRCEDTFAIDDDNFWRKAS